MATVVKKAPGDTDEKLISKFRRKVIQHGVINEIKDRQYFKSDAEKKKERLAETRRLRKKRR